jgi:hypothetical protein
MFTDVSPVRGLLWPHAHEKAVLVCDTFFHCSLSAVYELRQSTVELSMSACVSCMIRQTSLMFRSVSCLAFVIALLSCNACQEQAAVVFRSFNCCVYWYECEFRADTQKRSKLKSMANMYVSSQSTIIVARHYLP